MSERKNEDHLIRIQSSIEQDGETQKIELTTRGSYLYKNGCYYITYQEADGAGYEGCSVTLKVAEDGSRVGMLRFGKLNTQLLIERGRRHICHYETGFGPITMGVTADTIRHDLTDKGGSLRFSYLLDADTAALVSKSCIQVRVTPLQ